MPLTWINGPIIQAGESLSDPVDLTGGTLLRITMPKEWTDAEITFQISTDGDAYNDLHGYDGGEVSLPVVVGAAVLLPPDLMRGIGWIRFRSGSSGDPTPQPEQRNFALTVEVAPAGVTTTGAKPARTRTARRKTPRKTAKVRRKHRR
jgi:hypothetical protein